MFTVLIITHCFPYLLQVHWPCFSYLLLQPVSFMMVCSQHMLNGHVLREWLEELIIVKGIPKAARQAGREWARTDDGVVGWLEVKRRELESFFTKTFLKMSRREDSLRKTMDLGYMNLRGLDGWCVRRFACSSEYWKHSNYWCNSAWKAA